MKRHVSQMARPAAFVSVLLMTLAGLSGVPQSATATPRSSISVPADNPVASTATDVEADPDIAELSVAASAEQDAEDAVTVAEMPDSLKSAIKRDLNLEPLAWVRSTRLATEGSSLISQVRDKFPHDYSSAMFDAKAGRSTLSVTTQRAAEFGQSLGLAVKVVPWSSAQLKQIAKDFYAGLTPAQQASLISITPDAQNQTVAVRVAVADGAALASYPTEELPITLSLAAAGEKRTVVEAASGTQTGLTNGSGVFLNASCSLGFGAQNEGGEKFWLTAGHCAQDGRAEVMNTYLDNQVGERIGDLKWFQFGDKNANGSNWPGNASNADISAYSVTPTSNFVPSTEVNTYGANGVTVDGIADPTVGMPVCRSGITTGWQCGTVKSTDQQPLVSLDVLPGARPVDAFDMTVCSLPGDSGGPVMAGNLAVGTLSAVTNLPNPQRPGTCDTSATNGNQGQHTFAVGIRHSLAGSGLFLMQHVQAPTIKSLQAGEVTAPGEVLVSGTGATGDSVIIEVNGQEAGTATVGGNGAWEFKNARLATVGDTIITAYARRDAVNRSLPTSVKVKVAAAVAKIVSPTPGSALLALTHDVSGTATPNSSVDVQLNGVSVGTVTAGSDGSWLLSGVPFALGTATLVVTPSLDQKLGAASTATYQVNPLMVSIKQPDTIHAGGQTISGSATPNAQIQLSLNGNLVATGTADANGGWRVDLTLPSGAVKLRAVASSNGLTGTADLSFDVDRLAAPVIVDPAPGAPFSAGTRTVAGTSQPNATVTLTLNGLNLGSVNANSAGKWSKTEVNFSAGPVELSAYSSLSGSKITSVPVLAKYSVKAAPTEAADQQTELKASDLVIAPIPTGGLVPGKFTVKGTAPVGSKVTVLLNNKIVGVANVVSSIPNATSATWSLDVTLLPGQNTVKAEAARGGEVVATQTVLSVMNAEKSSAAADPAVTSSSASQNSPTTTSSTPDASVQASQGTHDGGGLGAVFWGAVIGGVGLLAAALWMFIAFRRKNQAESGPKT